MAYIFGSYLVEFVRDKHQITGEVFYPGERAPVGKVTCHFYNYNNPEDQSHIKDDALHIDILRVQIEHDNKGIGTFLMKKVLEYADKGKVKHVTTTPSPTGRITIANLKRFYQKFRFGTGFLMKKIEFVDEANLLADVLDMNSDDNENPVKRIIGEQTTTEQNNTETSGGATVKRTTGSADKQIRITKANRVAYLTVVHFLDDELESKNDILQVGASGAGVYGLYLARKGHNVTVIEPDVTEAEGLKVKAEETERLNILNKPFKDLQEYKENSMDAVLCFGPMESTLTLYEKEWIIKESYRICKEGGIVFVSFLSNEMMVMEKTFNDNYDYISGPKFDSLTLKAVCSDKRLLTFEEIETLFKMCRIKYNKRFAAEGISMLIRDKMEGMSERQFNTWMDYHYKICEKTEMLGCSNHIVYVISKPETKE